MAKLPEIIRGRDSRPFREVSRMQRQIERLFDELLSPGSFGSEYRFLTGFSPSAEVDENDKQYILTFDLPGLKKDDIQIEVADGQLRIWGERKEEKEKKEHGRFHTERFYGSFERTFSLPSNVKIGHIAADYKDGVLTITVPKSEEARAQRIKIGGEEKAA